MAGEHDDNDATYDAWVAEQEELKAQEPWFAEDAHLEAASEDRYHSAGDPHEEAWW